MDGGRDVILVFPSPSLTAQVSGVRCELAGSHVPVFRPAAEPPPTKLLPVGALTPGWAGVQGSDVPPLQRQSLILICLFPTRGF